LGNNIKKRKEKIRKEKREVQQAAHSGDLSAYLETEIQNFLIEDGNHGMDA
jgi:hypothetical protein